MAAVHPSKVCACVQDLTNLIVVILYLTDSFYQLRSSKPADSDDSDGSLSDSDDDKPPEVTLMPGAKDSLEGSKTKYLQDEVEDDLAEAPPHPPTTEQMVPPPPPPAANLELTSQTSSTGASVATSKKEPKYVELDPLLLGLEQATPAPQVKDSNSVIYVKVKPDSIKVPKVQSAPARAGRGECCSSLLSYYDKLCMHLLRCTIQGTFEL